MKFNFEIGSKHGKVDQWSSLSRSSFFEDGSCQHKHKINSFKKKVLLWKHHGFHWIYGKLNIKFEQL